MRFWRCTNPKSEKNSEKTVSGVAMKDSQKVVRKDSQKVVRKAGQKKRQPWRVP